MDRPRVFYSFPMVPVAHSLPCVLAQMPKRPVNSPAQTDGNGGHRSAVGDTTTHGQTDGLWRMVISPPIPTHLPVDEQVERIFRDTRLVDCNDAMARMNGFTRAADLIGTALHTLLIPTVQENQEYIRAIVLSNYRLEGAESVKRAADGSIKQFVLVGIVHDGLLTGAFGTQIDVTARLRLEQQARQAETITALNRLAGGVAHGFNNLLTTILTSVELLEESLDELHVAREDAGEIRRAARRGAELTRQLLALSQQQVLVPRASDLNVTVKRAVATMQRVIPANITINVTAAATPAVANVDGEELELVLVTLASFAAESLRQGGRLAFVIDHVTVENTIPGTPDTVTAGSYVGITVTDSAPSFPRGASVHLFEPFFGVELAGSGSGLALATLRGFMRQSGGSVILHEPAAGRSLTMFFPAATLAGGGEGTGTRALAPSSGTVLLAEDEPTVRLLMKRVLRRAGFVVLEASTGEDALELARSYQGGIDLLVTDVIMPGMGGGELARRLRQERPAIKVLHVSGYTAGALRLNEALEDGAAFLQKPFTPKGLIARVREVLAAIS